MLKQKYRPNNSLAQQITYIWDGDKMVQERIQTDNGTSNPDTVFRTYVYDPRSFAPLAMIISEPDQSTEPNLYDQFPREIFGEALDNVAATMGDQFPKHWLRLKNPIKEVLYFDNDHLGTPQRLIDKTGKVRWQNHTDAWGKQRSGDRLQGTENGNGNANRNYPEIAPEDYIDQPLRFQGQQYDKETGFHYNFHRYYDPHSGRYLSHDPIGTRGGANIYSYVDNPNGWIDPLGLNSIENPPMAGSSQPQVFGVPVPLSLPAVGGETFIPPSLPQGLVDAAAGFGDGVSFNLTRAFRDMAGIDGGVNPDCSSAYKFGGWGGTVVGLVSPVGKFAGAAKSFNYAKNWGWMAPGAKQRFTDIGKRKVIGGMEEIFASEAMETAVDMNMGY